MGSVGYMALVQHLLRWVTARRLTACLLLVVSVGMLFPLSYQSGNSPSEKDQTAPFPCQNRPCGCKTAEQCWKKCCCFTNAQKLAWAKSRGVRPPQYVVIAARSEACDKVAAKCCCQAKVTAGKSGQAADKPTEGGLTLSIDAQRCSGVDTTISGLPICVLPEMAVSFLVIRPASLQSTPPEINPLVPAERQPPTPPPRIFLS